MYKQLSRFRHFFPLFLIAIGAFSVMVYFYTSTVKALVIQEKDGLVSFEAENFLTQTLTSKRQWYLASQGVLPSVLPDKDSTSTSGASNNAYIEILPDTRVTDTDPLVHGESFSDTPGLMAVLTYEVNFTNTGRYYIWGRTNTPGPEDNGLHYGIDNTWPTSGKKAQWCGGARNWTWKNHQRDTGGSSCGVQGTIYFDINTPGVHTIMVSMREDGMELDKIVMTTDRNYVPQGLGPTSEGNPNVTTAPNPTATPGEGGSGAAQISGELRAWHKVTLTFDGPTVTETDTNNPFLNYRLNVTFTSPSGKQVIVPGYYAADGNAAETSATSGNKWRVHLAPDEVGQWSYLASFRQGSDVAVSLDPNAGTATSFNGASGTFSVDQTNKTGRDFRGKGMLKYVNQRYLQFAGTGEYFVKAGADSPENLFAYVDFDNTPEIGQPLKTWADHAGDWQSGDPTWKNGKGKGMIGVVNYLSSEGLNAFSFLSMNINGDDKNVYPYISPTELTRMDVSKLGQWEIVFEHADKKGMYLHFKTQETENDQLLDNGDLGVKRKLYFRELVARFGHHLALNWNLGEENDLWTKRNDPENNLLKSHAQFFKDIDPYDHHIVVHTFPGDFDEVYGKLIGSQSELTGTSGQIAWNSVFNSTKTWVDKSKQTGKPWVIANDEQTGANCGTPPDNHISNSTCVQTIDDIRKQSVWGNLMAGGGGIEHYFGYALAHSDLSATDFRSRDRMWDYDRFALQFFNAHIPFWLMNNNNGVTSSTSDFVLEKPGDIYAVYLYNGGTTNITLPAGTYSVKWYDPRNGGALQNGSVTQLNGGSSPSIGTAPNNSSQDWAVVVRDVTYNWEGSNPAPTNTPGPTATNTIKPTATIVPGTVCKANLNGDSIVDISDYSILILNFFKSNPNPSSTDMNQDGIVDLNDYSILVGEFFKECSVSALPITIEAEDYMNGGQGVGYNDLTSGNSVNNVSNTYRTDDVDIKAITGGYAVGHMQTSEWLTYQVNVVTPQSYAVVLKVGTSMSTGSVGVEIGGQTLSAAVPNTGAYSTFTDLTVGNVQLSAGQQEITVLVNNQYFDFDKLTLIPQ